MLLLAPCLKPDDPVVSLNINFYVQVKQHKAQQRPLPSRGSPQVTSPVSLMTSAPGSSVQPADHASPSTEPPSRWFKPETVNPSPLRCIQKEEQAMKELRQLYTNVRIARQVDS